MKTIIFNSILIIFLLFVVTGYLAGAKALIVTSNSMSPSINKGDVAIIFKNQEYDIRDVISFKKEGKIVTHRLTSKNNAQFITKGDMNKVTDFGLVSNKEVLGKVTFVVPFIGFFLIWIQSKFFSYIILFLFIYLLLEKVKDVKK